MMVTVFHKILVFKPPHRVYCFRGGVTSGTGAKGSFLLGKFFLLCVRDLGGLHDNVVILGECFDTRI